MGARERKSLHLEGFGMDMDSHTFSCRRKKNVGTCALGLLLDLNIDQKLFNTFSCLIRNRCRTELFCNEIPML